MTDIEIRHSLCDTGLSTTQEDVTMITTRTLGTSGPTVGALGLGCMGMSEALRPSRPRRKHRHLHAALDAGDHTDRHRRLLRHGPQRTADRRGPEGRKRERARSASNTARCVARRGWLGMDAGRPPPGTSLPTPCSAWAPTTSTSTGPPGSTRRCRSRTPSAPSPS